MLYSVKDFVVRLVQKLGLADSLGSYYYKFISYIGKGTVELGIGSKQAIYRCETIEEIRHFYPRYEEKEVINSLIEHTSESDVFYDVGGHIGIYTCLVGQKARETHSFEPHPKTAGILRENTERNSINAEVHEYGLSNEEGTVKVDTSGENVGGMVLPNTSGNMELKLRTLDGNIPEPDVMKIDVEGHEKKVLEGMKEMLDGCSCIFVEVHNDRLNDGEIDYIENLLGNKGFDLSKTTYEHGNHYHLKAIK